MDRRQDNWAGRLKISRHTRTFLYITIFFITIIACYNYYNALTQKKLLQNVLRIRTKKIINSYEKRLEVITDHIIKKNLSCQDIHLLLRTIKKYTRVTTKFDIPYEIKWLSNSCIANAIGTYETTSNKLFFPSKQQTKLFYIDPITKTKIIAFNKIVLNSDRAIIAEIALHIPKHEYLKNLLKPTADFKFLVVLPTIKDGNIKYELFLARNLLIINIVKTTSICLFLMFVLYISFNLILKKMISKLLTKHKKKILTLKNKLLENTSKITTCLNEKSLLLSEKIQLLNYLKIEENHEKLARKELYLALAEAINLCESELKHNSKNIDKIYNMIVNLAATKTRTGHYENVSIPKIINTAIEANLKSAFIKKIKINLNHEEHTLKCSLNKKRATFLISGIINKIIQFSPIENSITIKVYQQNSSIIINFMEENGFYVEQQDKNPTKAHEHKLSCPNWDSVLAIAKLENIKIKVSYLAKKGQNICIDLPNMKIKDNNNVVAFKKDR